MAPSPLTKQLITLSATLSAVLFLFGCQRSIASPRPVYPGDGGPPTIRAHCSMAAETGGARAHRWELIRWFGVGGAFSAVVSLPMVQAMADRDTRIGLGTALSVAALAAATTAMVSDRQANHHRALAVGYSACADIGDEAVAQMIAGEVYRLSFRSSVSAPTLLLYLVVCCAIRTARWPIDGPTGPPPPPPTSAQPFGPHGPRRHPQR